MAIQELITYIRQKQSSGATKEIIVAELLKLKCSESDIIQAFSTIEQNNPVQQEITPTVSTPQAIPDPSTSLKNSMKKCKSCKSDIDSTASKCPHCQTDQRNWFIRHPIWSFILVLFILGIFGSTLGEGANKGTSVPTASENSNTNNAQTATQAPVTQQQAQPTPIVVDATAFMGEYDKNKLAAQDKYTEKRLQFTAFIDNISSDIAGSYYLSLKPSNDQYYSGTTIQCYFADKSQLTSLANGQSVTVSGTAQDMSLGIVGLKDCSVVK